ncbi:hypothetical protein, partial [Arsenophonus sp.]|uniref:hypothetical protein n=1 Tax=Arsenophonus sp. TaxID=1872640 RepID=UPI00285A470D
CSLTIWNKLKIETHIIEKIVWRTLKTPISWVFVVMMKRYERAVSNSRRPAHSKRSVLKYVSIARTAQQRIGGRAAITQQKDSRRHLRVVRLSE